MYMYIHVHVCTCIQSKKAFIEFNKWIKQLVINKIKCTYTCTCMYIIIYRVKKKLSLSMKWIKQLIRNQIKCTYMYMYMFNFQN